MTRVLVAYATKMGATRDIAVAIADQLTQAGLEVTVSDARNLADLDGYDAAVVGSALYLGQWRPEAVTLLAQHAEHATDDRIWLYQSGPCGTDAHDQMPAPKRIRLLAAKIGANLPITFGGRLESATAIGFLARRMSKGPKAGDFRDFDAIRRWADDIGRQLQPPTVIAAPHLSRHASG